MKKIISLVLAVILSFGVFSIRLNASASSYSTGDIITFGSYPQSLVSDPDLIEALNNQTINWVSYGYYSGEGKHGTMVKSDYMKYADVTYGGEKYRAVTFSQYRPRITYFSGNADNSVQDTFGYTTNSVYWFKYESLEWVVLNPSSGLIICKDVIDSQPFCNTVYFTNNTYYSNNPNSQYINNFAYSSIRKWLNDDFYNCAFSTVQKNSISESYIDNSCYDSEYSQFDALSTTDKVFLLSYDDYHNPAYGFEDDPNKSDAMRMGFATDYSKCQGLTVANSSNGIANNAWNVLLRTPGKHSRYVCASVVRGRLSGTTEDAYETDNGIRPAMQINFSSFSKTYTLSYNANGGSNIPFPQTDSSSYIVSSVVPVRNGYTFIGWSTDMYAVNANYFGGNTINLTEDTVLYAVWQKNTVVVPPFQEDKKVTVSIRKPSVTSVNYGDAIILHADVENVPCEATVVWNSSNENFELSVSADGKTCKVKPASSGKTVFTVEIIDNNGNFLCSDTQEMSSNAGFFQKIIAFFKWLFGLNKTYTE